MPLVIPNIFTPDTLADANAVNANFSAVAAYVNGLTPSTSLGYYLSTALPSLGAAQNTANINSDLTTMLAAGGGTYVLPPGIVSINGPIIVGNGNYFPLHVTGASRGSTILQTANSDTFVIATNPGGDGSQLGVKFSNFYVKYNSHLTTGAAFHNITGEHNIYDGLTVLDAPTALQVGEGLQMNVFRCKFKYLNNTSPPGGAMVMLGDPTIPKAAIEFFMEDCTLYTTDINNGGTGGVGIWATAYEHIRLANLRIQGMQQGVILQPGTGTNFTLKAYLDDVYCETGNNVASATGGAAFVFCPTGNKSLYEITMFHCGSQGQTGGGTLYTGPGLVIDSTGAYMGGNNTGTTIDKVRIVEPLFNGWNGPGISIVSNASNPITNIEIAGGDLCSNGQTTAGTTASGLLVNGPVGVCKLRGITCNNTDGIVTGTTQQYGMSFINNGNGEITDCELVGNVTGPIGATSPGTIHCTNTEGVNFSGGVVTASVPTSGTTVSAAAYGYYGPSVINLSGGTVSSIRQGYGTTQLVGQTTPASIHLQAGENVQLNYTVAPTSFSWLRL